MADQGSAAAYHEQLSARSPSYLQYATTRQDLWKDPRFHQAQARLGHSSDYAQHYVQYLLPPLAQQFPSTGRQHLRFLDMGCAPGGLCETLLHRAGNATAHWSGVGVTLHENDGGLGMEVAPVQDRFEVRYGDVTHREAFIAECVREGEVGTFDLVNCGIVLDQTVRRKRTMGDTADISSADGNGNASAAPPMISFGEQLYTQLLVAARALRQDGSGVVMMALKTDFPSLPEMMPTLATLIKSSSSVRVIPTMYTMTCGKKQFYSVALGVDATVQLAEGIRRIWNLGTARYLVMKRAAIATKRARDEDDTRTATVTGSKGKLESVQHLVASGGNATIMTPSVTNTDSAVIVESSGFDACDTVAAVYATQTGKDLDIFFGMVSTALQSQARGQRLTARR